MQNAAPPGAASADLRLTPHFRLSEFTASQSATRLCLRNEPAAEHVLNLRRLAWLLEDVRTALGGVPIVISSGFRATLVNAAVGGASNPPSAHLTGRAADFTAPAFGSPLAICHRLIEARLTFDQLIYERGWVHLGIAFEGTAPRQQRLTAVFQPGKHTRYEDGLPTE